MEPQAAKVSTAPLSYGAWKLSSTTGPGRTSPSHIQIPSRLCNLQSKPRIASSHSHVGVSTQAAGIESATNKTQFKVQQDNPPGPSFLGSSRQKAWENEGSNRDKGTTDEHGPNAKKTVSFSSKMPLYKHTLTIRSPPSEHVQPTCPEPIEILNEGDFDDTDADNSLLLLNRNGFRHSAMTDTKASVLEAMSALEGALRMMQKKQQHLQQEHEKAMHEIREQHRLELSRERERLQNQILTLSKMNKTKSDTTQQTVEALEQRLAAKNAECSNLKAEFDAKSVALESEESLEKSKAALLQAQVESLQSQLAAKDREIRDLTSKLATESSQKLRLELSSQEEKQQLMAVLTATQQQTASLEHQLSCLNRELTLSRKPQQKQTPPTPDTEGLTKLVKLSQMDVERLQRLLSEERQKFSKLQEREVTVRSQLEEYQKSKAELSKELTETKKKKQDYSSTEVVCRGNKFAEGVEALKCSGKELQTRNAMLRADLRATQEIQHSLERKISLLEQTFQGHSSSKKRKDELEAELERIHTALVQGESQLSLMKEKLKTSITKPTSEMNESRVSELEVELCEANLQLNGVKDKFEAEVKATQHLKEELRCTQEECVVLQDQLQLQRETAALSLNRIQQTALRKQKKLVRHIKNLQKELKEAEAGEKGAKSDCLTYMAELSQVTTQLENANEKSKLLTSELKEKKAELRLAEEEISELTNTLEQQKTVQDVLETELSHERETHIEFRSQLTQRQECIRSLEAERDELKHTLGASVEEEQRRRSSLEAVVTHTNKQLSEMKQTVRQCEREAHRDLEMLRTEHKNQVKAKMAQLEQLKTTVRNLQRREKMAKEDLERCRESAESQRLELETRLDKTLADERHKTSSLTQENRSLKIKLGDLQSKVVELTKAQKEYEECIHKGEETKKSEKQMLFEEMTQHIQQQSDSHKYLEKLRIENEQTALQEKDRQMRDLKGELEALQQRRAQDEVLIESLNFENQLMRTQLRESHARGGATTRRAFPFLSDSKLKDKLPPIH